MIENYNVNDLVAPLFSQHHRQKCYLGLSFQQGKRKMIQINVPAEDLPTLLQAKPSENNDPDSGKNRPEVKGHAEEIKDYIIKRVKHNKPWIMGTLTANVDPNKIEYQDLGRGVCFVSIPRGTKLDITDGQHRKRAIHELIESHHSELIGDNDFPITLVLEEDFNQCQTDFRDMAQSRQLDQSLLVSFGEFEGRVGITKQLFEQVKMFKGKIEKIKRTPASKYKLIYTSNYIANAVGCAFENDKSATLEDYNVEQATNELVKAFNQFFDECSQTQYIANQDPDNLTVEEIDQFKEKSLLGVSIGLEILGRLLYYTYSQEYQSFNAEKVSQLAQLDWSRNSPLWENNVVTKDPNPKNPAKPYKISVGASNVKIAVNTALSQLGWMTYN
ncbi:MAG: DNA sulfur modification protein DndB [Microcoleaceae cyanobacterium]